MPQPHQPIHVLPHLLSNPSFFGQIPALLLVLLIFSDSAALIQAATTPGDAHDENEERKQQALNGKDETDQHEGAAAHGWSHDLEQTMLDQIIVGVMTSGYVGTQYAA